MYGQKITLILLFDCDDQRVAASSKINCSMHGPSDESRISLSSVSLFRASVLILFSVENPLSQSAVDTGSMRAMLARWDIY